MSQLSGYKPSTHRIQQAAFAFSVHGAILD